MLCAAHRACDCKRDRDCALAVCDDAGPHEQELDEAYEELDHVVQELDAAALAAEKCDDAEGRTAWSTWVEEALSGGAGKAHRFVKGSEQWHPTHTHVMG
eukprot:6289945-Karenia_brevis.AAC.1